MDDDNKPAPKNVPTAGNVTSNNELNDGQVWGYDGLDQRAATGAMDYEPAFQNNWNLVGKSAFDLFKKLWPYQFFIKVIVEQTSQALVAQNLPALSEGELLRYLGIWLLMATCSGWNQRDFWDCHEPSERRNACPYRLGKYMTKNRFDNITRELRFTKANKPTFVDRIWEVRQLIDEWNKNMASIFIPSWILCLDESMSIWFSMFTCPGWVFCPRKPHPFGNEYHSMCCAISGVMMSIKLVEGKIDRGNCRSQSMRTLEVKLSDYCCICVRPVLVQAAMLS